MGEYPLSHAQRALWFLYRLDRANTAYNVWDSMRLRGPLDLEAMRRAIAEVVARHPILRATFHEIDGEPRQRIHRGIPVPLEVVDGRGWSESRQRARLEAAAHQPFDLEAGPAGKAFLLRVADDEALIAFVLHHIVTDLWSLLVVIGEFLECYRAGGQAELPPPEMTYFDHIRDEADLLAGEAAEKMLDYWRAELAEPLPALQLPTDRPRPATQTSRGAVAHLALEPRLTTGLKELSKQHGATMFMTLVAAYETLLHRYTGQDDIIVGSPTSGRSRAAQASVVGDFINPVAIRGDLSGNPRFTEFLAALRQTILDAFDHHDYPFSLLVERLRRRATRAARRSFKPRLSCIAQASHARGFNAFMLGERHARMRVGELEIESFPIDQCSTQFDLTCQMAESGGELALELQYNTDLFDRETMLRFAAHFESLLMAIVADPEARVDDLPLLAPDERRRLLVDCNATAQRLPLSRSMRCSSCKRRALPTPWRSCMAPSA